MDWIFNHLWVLIVVAGIVAKILQAVRGQPADAPKAGPAKRDFSDPELAERTRKVREEIRRKIEERRSQSGRAVVLEPGRPRLRSEDRSPEATPPPSVLDLPEMLRRVLEPETPPAPPPVPVEPVGVRGELARQAALAEQLRQVVARKTVEETRAAFASSVAEKDPAALLTVRGAVADELRDPAALRRAFVLREVLGPPVALRTPGFPVQGGVS